MTLSPRRSAQLGLGAAGLVLVGSVVVLVRGGAEVASSPPAVRLIGPGHVDTAAPPGVDPARRSADAASR